MNQPQTVRTKAGTELPLMSLKGKPYLQPAYRLVWFREEHPNWGIEIEFPHMGDGWCIAKATIKDEKGRVIACAHKTGSKKEFALYLEKAETGAMGRALAMCGYGTQFGEDIDDDDLDVSHTADSPVAIPKRNPSEFNTFDRGPSQQIKNVRQAVSASIPRPTPPLQAKAPLQARGAPLKDVAIVGRHKAATLPDAPPMTEDGDPGPNPDEYFAQKKTELSAKQVYQEAKRMGEKPDEDLPF